MPLLFFNINAAEISETRGIDFRRGLKLGIESIELRKLEAIKFAPQFDLRIFSETSCSLVSRSLTRILLTAWIQRNLAAENAASSIMMSTGDLIRLSLGGDEKVIFERIF